MSKTHRTQTLKVNLLDTGENLLGELPGVEGGGFEYNTNAVVKTSGSLDIVGVTSRDWTNLRVQPVISVNGEDHPLGVFLPTSPETAWDDHTTTQTVDLLDKLAILDQAVTPTMLSIPAGTNLTDAVTAVIEMSGEPAGTVNPSNQTTRTDATWEPGTTLLRVVNDLLESANYFSLWCDGWGRYQITPYVDTKSRPIVAEWEEGENATFTPDFDHLEDIYTVPNRVICVSQATGDEEALVSIAENTNPASPYSFQARGRWIDHVEENVETTGQTALNDYAARRLQELSSAMSTVTITHLYQPFNLNDAATFTSHRAGITGRHVITKYSIPWAETGLTTTTLRKVVDV